MIETALYDLLSDDTAIAAITAARIYPLVAPQGVQRAYVTFQRISGVRSMPINGPNGFVVARYQLGAFANNPESAFALGNAIRERLDGFKGEAGGHRIQRIWADGDSHAHQYQTGADENSITQVIQDFRIAYSEDHNDLAALPPSSGITPATLTFLLTKDAFLRDTSPTTNFGNNQNLKIGVGVNTPGTIDRSIIHVDLSLASVEGTVIPDGATVIAASLALTALPPNTVGGTAAKVRRLTRQEWVETECSWDNFITTPFIGPWTTPGGDYVTTDEVNWSIPTGAGAFTISGLATLVQDALDNQSKQLHLILMNVDEATNGRNATFRDSEYGPIPSQRPLLTVSYA